jgi:hypothetical protein
MASKNVVVASGIEKDGQTARRRVAPGASSTIDAEALEEKDDKKAPLKKVGFSAYVPSQFFFRMIAYGLFL